MRVHYVFCSVMIAWGKSSFIGGRNISVSLSFDILAARLQLSLHSRQYFSERVEYSFWTTVEMTETEKTWRGMLELESERFYLSSHSLGLTVGLPPPHYPKTGDSPAPGEEHQAWCLFDIAVRFCYDNTMWCTQAPKRPFSIDWHWGRRDCAGKHSFECHAQQSEKIKETHKSSSSNDHLRARVEIPNCTAELSTFTAWAEMGWANLPVHHLPVLNINIDLWQLRVKVRSLLTFSSANSNRCRPVCVLVS